MRLFEKNVFSVSLKVASDCEVTASAGRLIRFSVWLVSGYAYVFIDLLLFVVIVILPFVTAPWA